MLIRIVLGPGIYAILQLFLLLLHHCRLGLAEKAWLLNTKNATSELNWRTWSNRDESDGWLEETSYSKKDNVNYQVYSTCNLDHQEIENWLLIPRIDTGEANRLHVGLEFTIRKCQVVPNVRGGGCKETLKLYAAPLRQGEDLQHEWVGDRRWRVVDTIVANSDDERINVQTSAYTVTTPYVHFALRNSGACSSILSVKISYEVCPAQERELVKVPRTVTSQDAHSFITVVGQCIHNSSPVQTGTSLAASSPPTAICKADGSWQMVGDVRCECSPGYIPSLKTGLCAACGAGTYKWQSGPGECIPCPGGSSSAEAGSKECKCNEGSNRRASANISEPCHSDGVDFKVDTDSGEERIRTQPEGRRRGGENETTGWLHDLFSPHDQRVWPWVVLCLALMLLLCCALLVASQLASSNRKQMSDLDVLDNYKQGTITPDYIRSNGMAGGPLNSVLSGSALRKKFTAPLIPAYGTHRSPPGHGHLSVNRKYRPYVDPKTYEDPSQALAEFTNEIEPSYVEVTRVIGAGEFGEVCCGRLTLVDAYGNAQQQIVAVKTLLPGSTPRAKADFLTEASVMGQFEHENVVHLIGVVTKSEPVMIITEYMLNGSLDKFLSANDGRLENAQLVSMLCGIACGMRYLTEQKGFVHRDLAARNVLVDDRLECKIADFGLSRGLSPGEDELSSSSTEQQYYTSNGGKIPIRWTAPEAIIYHKYTAASDTWSFGVVVWEVFSFGQRPYWDWSNQQVIEEIKAGFRLPAPMDCPNRIYNLMLDCWREERQRRPTFTAILSQLNSMLNDFEHPYNLSTAGRNYGFATAPRRQPHPTPTAVMETRNGSQGHILYHPTPPTLPGRLTKMARHPPPAFPPPSATAATMVGVGGKSSGGEGGSDLNFFV